MSARARRPRWGQNFLVDAALASTIVDWAGVDGRAVVEIGPGRGALTEHLAGRARRLILIEIDPDLADRLRVRYAANAAIEVIEADVLRVDLAALADPPFVVVGNLPYESGTAIVRRLVALPAVVAEAVVMLQEEVCQRMLAGAGEEHYGALSIFTALRADVTSGPIAPATSFRPRPKVESRVIRLRPLPRVRWDVGDEEHFDELVRVAFSGRRKMLRNTLGAWLARRLGPDRSTELLTDCAIEPTARPEDVAPEKFARLACRSYELLQASARAS
jgi:16S rRNA (adenine1518-N6/adenine1519-N6)-dimethyltransferase